MKKTGIVFLVLAFLAMSLPFSAQAAGGLVVIPGQMEQLKKYREKQKIENTCNLALILLGCGDAITNNIRRSGGLNH